MVVFEVEFGDKTYRVEFLLPRMNILFGELSDDE